VVAGVFVTAFYSFRMYFLVFHGKEHFHHKPFPGEHDAHAAHDDHADHADHGEPGDHSAVHTPHESPWVVTAPLILLAIPSVVIGFLTIQAMLFSDFFKDSILVNLELHPAMEELAREFHGATAMAMHSVSTLPLWLALAGVVTAYVFYMLKPGIPAAIARTFSPVVKVLENKYYMDWFNENILAAGARKLGVGLWKGGDVGIIDGFINGSANGVGAMAGVVRTIQTGYLSWYALVMVLGIFGLMTWQLWPFLLSFVAH
jgi:NADH-quinone oxidoreductase subunit L